MTGSSDAQRRGSEYLYDALVDAGVKFLIGLPGTQTLPLDRTVSEREDIQYIMARNETSIPHIAWGHYEGGGNVAATLTVPGPGDANASHGLKNALDDNVPIIHVSPIADPSKQGRHAIHEVANDTYDNVVKANLSVDNPKRLREVISRGIGIALEPPLGPVRLGIPSSFLSNPVSSPEATFVSRRTKYNNSHEIEEASVKLAKSQRPVVYVGGGARRSPNGSEVVSELVEILNAPVVASYKGKGVFPEDDDRFVGVSGSDLPSGGRAVLEAADVVLALGTDFDGPNTANWSLPMGDSLIHVDLNPDELGLSYKADTGIILDVSVAVEQITKKLRSKDLVEKWKGQRIGRAVREEYEQHLSNLGILGGSNSLTTPAVLRRLRQTLPDETIVTTDIGGHRIWTKNCFPVYDRESFITAGSWAGMGVGLPSAIGAKLANPEKPVVTFTGDGCLFMTEQELHTAASYDLDLTVVVFNDADYGIISKSPKINQETEGRQFSWSSPDWVGIAEAYGCSGRRIANRDELIEGIEWGMNSTGPTLLDVMIDQDEPSPFEASDFDTDINVNALSRD